MLATSLWGGFFINKSQIALAATLILNANVIEMYLEN